VSDETTANAAARPGRRARFAAWRRERPFAGAVLTILSGFVLWFSGRLQLDSFEIQLGIEGMQSTLLPVALVALGALVLAQPQFRVFYGVITLAIAVYSLLGVNLGGFGVGMVLGVVGGILVVSWLPRASGPAAAADDDPGADATCGDASAGDEAATSGQGTAVEEPVPGDLGTPPRRPGGDKGATGRAAGGRGGWGAPPRPTSAARCAVAAPGRSPTARPRPSAPAAPATRPGSGAAHRDRPSPARGLRGRTAPRE
jgi:hypothetical protein